MELVLRERKNGAEMTNHPLGVSDDDNAVS